MAMYQAMNVLSRMANAAVARMAEMEYLTQRMVSSSSYGQARSPTMPCSWTSSDLRNTMLVRSQYKYH